MASCMGDVEQQKIIMIMCWLTTGLGLHLSQVAHQARTYPGFSNEATRSIYFYSPLDGMLVCQRVSPSIKFTSNHLHDCVQT